MSWYKHTRYEQLYWYIVTFGYVILSYTTDFRRTSALFGVPQQKSEVKCPYQQPLGCKSASKAICEVWPQQCWDEKVSSKHSFNNSFPQQVCWPKLGLAKHVVPSLKWKRIKWARLKTFPSFRNSYQWRVWVLPNNPKQLHLNTHMQIGMFIRTVLYRKQHPCFGMFWKLYIRSNLKKQSLVWAPASGVFHQMVRLWQHNFWSRSLAKQLGGPAKYSIKLNHDLGKVCQNVKP